MGILFKRAATKAELIPERGGTRSFVTAVTPATAEQVIAYDASVSLLASIISSLPLRVFIGEGEQQRPAAAPAWLDDPAGAGYGLADWLQTWVTSWGYRGNSVATVEGRDGNGVPRQLIIRPLDHVAWQAQAGWTISGQAYRSSDVLHYRRWPRPGQRFGSSPIERHATTLGLSLASARFGKQWFDDGAHPQSVMESDQALEPEEVERIRARILDPARGSREPIILGSGLKISSWQVAPEESQFLQTQSYTAAQVCRILGPGLAEILGYSTGDSNTYRNREQTALDLLAYTVNPLLKHLERSLSKLMTPAQGTFDGRYVQFDRSELLETDLKTRFEAYRIALGPSEPFITANEARRPEQNLPPVPWGDSKPTIQGDPTTQEAAQ